jgi:hypothetical protein
MITARPDLSSMMLLGFKSRWTMDSAWMAPSPEQTWRATFSVCSVESFPTARAHSSDEVDTVDLTDVVHPANVRVRHLACDVELAAETIQGSGLGCAAAHELESNGATKLGVDRLVDLPHASFADTLDDRVATPERSAGREGLPGRLHLIYSDRRPSRRVEVGAARRAGGAGRCVVVTTQGADHGLSLRLGSWRGQRTWP